jgi:hypothetical protein
MEQPRLGFVSLAQVTPRCASVEKFTKKIEPSTPPLKLKLGKKERGSGHLTKVVKKVRLWAGSTWDVLLWKRA